MGDDGGGGRGEVDAGAALEFFFEGEDVAFGDGDAGVEGVVVALGFEDADGEFDPAGIGLVGDGVVLDEEFVGFDVGFEDEGAGGVICAGKFYDIGLVFEGVGGDAGGFV